ncbi:MAG: DUF1684 domain-containing protein [Actinomycetota bacterium]|nr:DUF1684 domain-containing protein [Actinomycetota bacterium]
MFVGDERLLRVSLTLLDWRRRVAALYAEIRRTTDPSDGHELWRTTRNELLRRHPESPLTPDDRASFSGVDVAPYDPALRFELEVDTDVAPCAIDVPTGPDGVLPLRRIGSLHLATLGDLDVWWLGTYGGGLFVPVKDGLAGKETFGGGRYLLDTVKGADLGGDGRWLVVDMNFAYNPSCAYDPRWVCPLAPPSNTLSAPLRAGERTFAPSPAPGDRRRRPD